jgi:hypothetical protein
MIRQRSAEVILSSLSGLYQHGRFCSVLEYGRAQTIAVVDARTGAPLVNCLND